MLEELSRQVESALAETMPEVEVVLVERPSPGRIRVYLDREPGGVDLAVCEQATRNLAFLRDRYALEVSSPGPERPLTRPEHFARAIGRRVAVRTGEPLDGRRNFEGRLVRAGDGELEVDQDGTPVRIPQQAVRRARLVFEPAGGTR
ncbi:MAG TPA: ribosome maturation factor RimP [Thermoleophilia bacterium]|nr:ribosome maturation factor RimP [Thermoleophilia bacterium]